MSGRNKSQTELFGRRLTDALAPVHINAADAILPVYEDFHNLIYRDKVTGLLNREGFEERLRAIKETKAADYPNDFLVIGMLDVDRFKDVNDGFGHKEGDKALKKIGDIITSCLREGDLVARWGGDEYAVAMLLHHDFEGTTHANVAKGLDLNIKKRLVEAIKAGDNEPLRLIGVSIGMEILRLSELDRLDEFIDAADSRMYSKKHETAGEAPGRRKAGRAVVKSARRASDKPATVAESA